MKSIVLVQIFSVKETNQTHSIGYVEDRGHSAGRKRYAKTAVLNLSTLPYILPANRSIKSIAGIVRKIVSKYCISRLSTQIPLRALRFPCAILPFAYNLSTKSLAYKFGKDGGSLALHFLCIVCIEVLCDSNLCLTEARSDVDRVCAGLDQPCCMYMSEAV